MHIISGNERKGNDICATVTHDDHHFDAQDLSTVHAFVAQSFMVHYPDLTLLQNGCLANICDKE